MRDARVLGGVDALEMLCDADKRTMVRVVKRSRMESLTNWATSGGERRMSLQLFLRM